jgi:integrase
MSEILNGGPNYELLWLLGGSQSDIASLQASDIDWEARTISYRRMKTSAPVTAHSGQALAEILRTLPKEGPLFPKIITWKESDRAKAFIRRRGRVGITGVTLHSYRYARAERAKTAGYPERFAMEHLGHKSKAIHQAYCKRLRFLFRLWRSTNLGMHVRVQRLSTSFDRDTARPATYPQLHFVCPWGTLEIFSSR